MLREDIFDIDIIELHPLVPALVVVLPLRFKTKTTKTP